MENYGLPVLHLAKHIKKLGRAEVLRRFRENRKAFIAKSKSNDGFTYRLSVRYAILITTLQLANEAMKLELSYDFLLNTLVQNEVETADRKDLAVKAYDYLLEVANVHSDRFSFSCNRSQIISPAKETWGIKVYLDKVESIQGRKYKTIIYFAVEKFKELLEKGKFEDSGVVIKKLKDGGYLDFEKGKNIRTRKITFGGNPIPVYGIRIFDPEETEAVSRAEILERIARFKDEWEKFTKGMC
jgi:hypothetical protein